MAMPLSHSGSASQGTLLQSTADNGGELFDVVDDQNRVTGQESRSIVHARGLKHRAVYCFVFNPQGELLLQQRSPQKKIGPLQWDLSVAEHLQPGEGYREAAARGLREELGIEVEEQRLAEPLVEPHLRQLHVPEVGVLDCEFVTSFRLDDWDGKVVADASEVHAWRYARVEEVCADMAQHPQRYTPWFLAEIFTVQQRRRMSC